MSTSLLTLLFADICNSTQLYERLGDIKAKQLVSDCLESIRQTATIHQGTVVKTIGDELLVRFDKPEQALIAALAMQSTRNSGLTAEIETLQKRLDIRVGFHCGPTIQENDDVFGDAVNTAARLVTLTKPRQILTSKETVDMLPSQFIVKCRHIDRAAVKGKADKLDIYEVFDQEEDLTQMTEGVIKQKNKYSTLIMRYDHQEFVFRSDRSQFTLGRGPQCDIVIREELASREHVTLESREGKIFIVDLSTNGTWIRSNQGEEIFLRREEMLLPNTGDMSFGKSFIENSDKLLHFRIAEE